MVDDIPFCGTIIPGPPLPPVRLLVPAIQKVREAAVISPASIGGFAR
jgi:hypothetical protein